MEGKELVSPGEFVQRLGISRWAFRTWRRAGILPAPCIQAGRITRWSRAAVEKFATQGVTA